MAPGPCVTHVAYTTPSWPVRWEPTRRLRWGPTWSPRLLWGLLRQAAINIFFFSFIPNFFKPLHQPRSVDCFWYFTRRLEKELFSFLHFLFGGIREQYSGVRYGFDTNICFFLHFVITLDDTRFFNLILFHLASLTTTYSWTWYSDLLPLLLLLGDFLGIIWFCGFFNVPRIWLVFLHMAYFFTFSPPPSCCLL